jgi:hypothetical protein
VGAASWTDKTLLASGWYPPEADRPKSGCGIGNAERDHSGVGGR